MNGSSSSWWFDVGCRALFVVVGLALWYWTQRIIGSRTVAAESGKIGDTVLDRLAWANAYFHEHPRAADILLVCSSAVIDLLGVFLLASSIFGPSVRPFLGLLIVFALRQICQILCALPKPPGMIWRDPGWPSVLVTYKVGTDFFFSGHTGLAVLGAMELARLDGCQWVILGVLIVVIESSTVLVLRAHYTMDVFTGAVVALCAAMLAQQWAPWCDGVLAQLRGDTM